VVPGKLVAFSGPANVGNEIAGYRLHTPEDYWDYWRKKGVTAVVRLNKQVREDTCLMWGLTISACSH
jgi:cell division cycle 14